MSDTLQRFLFEEAAARGEVVQLDAAWQAVLETHDYPPRVRTLLGEMIAAAALLSATLKIDGNLTMQIAGDGPVTMLVADAGSDNTVRGLARWNGSVPEGSLHDAFGNGRLAITIEPKGGKRYQGIVPLDGESIATAIEHYLFRSEQLETRLWLAADDRRCGGLLLQQLPEQERDLEAWQRLTVLADTIRPEELTGIEPGEVVHRLFHEEDRRLFEAERITFHCHCSREKVANTLRSLGREECDSILAEHGSIEVDCQFCNRHYHFDAVDVGEVFVEVEQLGERGTTRH